MGKRISSQTRKELLEAMRRRYCESSKMDKARILDEFVVLTGYHRKHGVSLLSQCEYPGRFADGQLRTLQRRVREWRQVMARKLVYACINGRAEMAKSELVGVVGAW